MRAPTPVSAPTSEPMLDIQSVTDGIAQRYPTEVLCGAAHLRFAAGPVICGVNLPAVREACSSSCPTGKITDCFGNCVWADQLGDEFCDDGPHESLACWARNFDNGDCNACPPDEAPDCNGNCGPVWWIGDGICDEGGGISQWNGAFISYDCSNFRYDEATCLSCIARLTHAREVCRSTGFFGSVSHSPRQPPLPPPRHLPHALAMSSPADARVVIPGTSATRRGVPWTAIEPA